MGSFCFEKQGGVLAKSLTTHDLQALNGRVSDSDLVHCAKCANQRYLRNPETTHRSSKWHSAVKNEPTMDEAAGTVLEPVLLSSRGKQGPR